ncbi:MAG: hypothetical protein AAFV01_17780, partial [Bacteroidota bacterium]
MLTDESIKAIAANCPSLELLSIQGCRALTHESIKAVPASCLVPESLRETWEEHKHNIVSEDGTTIDFGHCYDWDTDILGFKYFTQDQLFAVTDAFVVSLLSAKVTSINLAYCRSISDVLINAIAANCPALVSLNVALCDALTDEAIMAIAANCLSLASLGVCDCRALTDKSITALAANCH